VSAPVASIRMLCPSCKHVLVENAHEGGIALKSRAVVLDPSIPRALLTCPECRSRVELSKGRLLLFRVPPARRPPVR
jgi:hypothetical protein